MGFFGGGVPILFFMGARIFLNFRKLHFTFRAFFFGNFVQKKGNHYVKKTASKDSWGKSSFEDA